MSIFTLDFETFYTREYSLSKLTTEEYIRHPDFEVIGVSVKKDFQPAEWFSGSFEDTKKFLLRFAWENGFMLAHNNMFDAAILHWKFGILAKGYLDTLSMGRVLHGVHGGLSLRALAQRYGVGQKGHEVESAIDKRREDFTPAELAAYGVYCDNDTDLCRALFDLMKPKFDKGELKLIDLTLRMFIQPEFLLDQPYLITYLEKIKEGKAKLLEECGLDAQTIRSDDKLAEVLKSFGVDPPVKTSPKTGKTAWAFAKTDSAFKALLDSEDDRIAMIVEARFGVKTSQAEKRTERFIGISERGPLPVPLKVSGAISHRYAASESINMQNLPSRGSVTLKNAIYAPPGYVIISSDSSQIEARTLAMWAGQWDLVAAFRRGDDVYKQLAAEIYNKPEADVTTKERYAGKVTFLQCLYQSGAAKLQHTFKSQHGIIFSLEECQKFVHAFRTKYAAIAALWKKASQCIEALHHNLPCALGHIQAVHVDHINPSIILPNGFTIRYPELQCNTAENGWLEFSYLKGKERTKIYGGKFIENGNQAIAFLQLKEAAVSISKRYPVKLNVHDEWSVLVKYAEIETAVSYIEECMRAAPWWCPELPLACETKVARRYGGIRCVY